MRKKHLKGIMTALSLGVMMSFTSLSKNELPSNNFDESSTKFLFIWCKTVCYDSGNSTCCTTTTYLGICPIKKVTNCKSTPPEPEPEPS